MVVEGEVGAMSILWALGDGVACWGTGSGGGVGVFGGGFGKLEFFVQAVHDAGGRDVGDFDVD